MQARLFPFLGAPGLSCLIFNVFSLHLNARLERFRSFLMRTLRRFSSTEFSTAPKPNLHSFHHCAQRLLPRGIELVTASGYMDSFRGVR
jgi:hypothetical protein